jgi:hypothetical protein
MHIREESIQEYCEESSKRIPKEQRGWATISHSQQKAFGENTRRDIDGF